jgi:signal transduction histidine kinase
MLKGKNAKKLCKKNANFALCVCIVGQLNDMHLHHLDEAMKIIHSIHQWCLSFCQMVSAVVFAHWRMSIALAIGWCGLSMLDVPLLQAQPSKVGTSTVVSPSLPQTTAHSIDSFKIRLLQAPQQPLIDSLKRLLTQALPDTIRVQILNRLAWLHRTFDIQQALFLGGESLHLAELIQYHAGWAQVANYLGVFQRNIGEYAQSMQMFYLAKELAEKHQLPKELGYAYNNIGDVYRLEENYVEAIDHIKKAEEIFRRLGDKQGMAYSQMRLGEIYQANAQYPEALARFDQALSLRQALKDYSQMMAVYLRIAQVYRSQKRYAEIEKILAALSSLSKITNDASLEVSVLNTVAVVSLDVGQYDRAIAAAGASLKNAQRLDLKQMVEQATDVLAKACAAKGQYKEAYAYQQLYTTTQSQLRSQEMQQSIANARIKYEINKRQIQLEKEQTSRRAAVIAGTAISVLLLVIMTLVLLNAQRQRKANTLLRETNTRITEQQRLLEQQAMNIDEANIVLEEQNLSLLHAKDQAEAANRAKTQFLANMSHELRTPMNAILGFTEVLSELNHDEVQQAYLKKIQTSGRVLMDILNDILELARSEAGTVQPEREPVLLVQLIQDVCAVLQTKAREKELEFAIIVAPSVPEIVLLDGIRLKHVLHHLVNNAIKFTEEGEVCVTVTASEQILIHNQNTSVTLTISIQDTGIGIAPAQHEHIFEPFFQQDTSDTRQYGGTGLGLTIVKRLLTIIGGSVQVESELGGGSTFTVTLPNVVLANPEMIETMLAGDDVHSSNVVALDHISSDKPQIQPQREPYAASDYQQADTQHTTQMTNSDRHWLCSPECYRELHETFVIQWHVVAATMNNLDVEAFAGHLADAAVRHQAPDIAQYAHTLRLAAESFRLTEMNMLFQEFPHRVNAAEVRAETAA